MCCPRCDHYNTLIEEVVESDDLPEPTDLNVEPIDEIPPYLDYDPAEDY